MLLQLDTVEHRASGARQTQALAGISLSVDRGSFVGVWGNRLSGKSTLLRVASGLEVPAAGTVAICGKSTAAMTTSERGQLRLREIGLVDADAPPALDRLLVDVVGLPVRASGSRSQTRARAVGALEYVNLRECADNRWRELSTSEQALALIARAIVRDPSILLVDDVSADLDDMQQDEVATLLHRLAQERDMAVLMTTSTMSALAHTDESLVLRAGRVTRFGGPATGGEVVQFRGGR
jgi:putative ABC transport system ATP-binding protein